MSERRQALRSLVVDKLVDVAEEIVSLFEQTLVEYQGEVLQCKLLQQAQVVIHKQDIETIFVGAESDPEPIIVKKEEDSALTILLPSANTQENVKQSTKNVGERLSRSEDHRPYSCSNTNGPRDEGKVSTKCKNSAAKSVVSKARLKRLKTNPKARLQCSVCSRKFSQRHSLMRHIRSTHNKERLHTCTFCQKGFFRRYEYVVHMRIHTGERPFSCSVCNEGYRSQQSLRDHQRSQKHHTKEQSDFIGAHCGPEPVKSKQTMTNPLSSVKTEEDVKQSTENPGMENRLDAVTEPSDRERPGRSLDQRPLRCSGTNKPKDEGNGSVKRNQPKPKSKRVGGKARPSKIRNVHIKQTHVDHTGEWPFCCSDCGEIFTSSKSLGKHQLLQKHGIYSRRMFDFQTEGSDQTKIPSLKTEPFAHSERLFEASHSKLLQRPHVVLYKDDIETVTVGSNPEHELVKLEELEVSSLNIARTSVKTEENMEQSATNTAEENRLDSLGEQSEGDLHLDNNMSSDTDNSSDWEATDNVGSSRYNGLVVSSDLGKNDKPHTCEQCCKSFKSEKLLKAHLRIHRRSFTCRICSKVFNNRESYREHTRSHTFRCPICQREFAKLAGLREHITVHTGEKPHSCSICQMKFRLKKNLQRHMYVHKDHRPFRCSVCQRGFTEKYSYVNHMRVHTGEKPFKCSLCDKSFRENKSLKSHLRTHKDSGEIMEEELE